jgi:hypothetical protein
MVAISKVMSGRKRSVHYVNNKDFLNALIEYRNQSIEIAEKEIPDFKVEDLKKWNSPNKPKVPNYIGECFLKIANHLFVMVLKIVFNILIILIQRSLRIHLLILLKLFIMLF